MASCVILTLYGSSAARESARAALENLPQVRRVDLLSGGAFRLLLHAPLHENSLIPLLAPCGISGFRLE